GDHDQQMVFDCYGAFVGDDRSDCSVRVVRARCAPQSHKRRPVECSGEPAILIDVSYSFPRRAVVWCEIWDRPSMACVAMRYYRSDANSKQIPEDMRGGLGSFHQQGVVVGTCPVDVGTDDSFKYEDINVGMSRKLSNTR